MIEECQQENINNDRYVGYHIYDAWPNHYLDVDYYGCFDTLAEAKEFKDDLDYKIVPHPLCPIGHELINSQAWDEDRECWKNKRDACA